MRQVCAFSSTAWPFSNHLAPRTFIFGPNERVPYPVPAVGHGTRRTHQPTAQAPRVERPARGAETEAHAASERCSPRDARSEKPTADERSVSSDASR